MHKKTIAVVTEHESDLLKVFIQAGLKVEVLRPNQLSQIDLQPFYSFAVLGGVNENPISFYPRNRIAIEKQIEQGKKVFCEFCDSIGNHYFPKPVSTRFKRLAFCLTDGEAKGVHNGDLLDDQCNMTLQPYASSFAEHTPILQYVNVIGHSNVDMEERLLANLSDRALWIDTPNNLMICSFRISNFIHARFAPKDKWKQLANFIMSWLTDQEIQCSNMQEAYYTKEYDEKVGFDKSLEECIHKAMQWFNESRMLLNNGKDGVLEGRATEIYPDGNQEILPTLRNDCTGETSLAFFMYSLTTEEKSYQQISDNLASVCFDLLQDKSDSALKGMMRWSQNAWGVCYQDDVARVLIPQLLKCLYTQTDDYLQECIDALDFLVRTTGTDGLRVSRTDNINLSPEEIQRLSSHPSHYPSAHYNGYYLAALLLGYKLTKIEKYKEVALKGMETLMDVYPNTVREHSETQELCRLILPLSWLYWITKQDKHKQWLYDVTKDLMKFRHPSGGYLEWDTGYKAHRSPKKETEESSLLAENGDPVMDLLYSLNWLPVAFAQAYFVTNDTYFKQLWQEIAHFMMSAQLQSENKQINGGWARAYDVDLKEVYGMNKDTGWGPWAIESGWTVAEIVSGLMMGKLEDTLKEFYE